MFGCLVVPLDGSELAEQALPYAVRLAKVGRGRLVLFRDTPMPAASGVIDVRQYQAETHAEAEHYLASVADRISSMVPVDTVTSIAHTPAEGILHTATRHPADAIVMATHGRGGLSHLLYGSVAEAVLATSHVPVFLVHARPGEATSAPFDPVAARLMVPLDGSSLAEAALSTAVEFLGPAGELVLASVVDAQGGEEAETREYLNGVARRLRHENPGMHVSTEVRLGDPAVSLALAVAERHVDLVVMATHGRTGIKRAVVGSVAGGVLRNASSPLLLVGPTSQGATQNSPSGSPTHFAPRA